MTQPNRPATMVAVVVPQDQIRSNTTPMRIALFNEDWTPIKLDGASQSALKDTIAKLEERVAQLEHVARVEPASTTPSKKTSKAPN